MSPLRPLGLRVVQMDEPIARPFGQPTAPFDLDVDREPPALVQESRLRGPEEVELVKRLHAALTATMGATLETAAPSAIQAMLAERFPAVVQDARPALGRIDRARIQDAILHEIVGFGPIQGLLEDETVSEVMVNGPDRVWIERDGRLYLTDITFADAAHLIRIIQRIVAPLGRRCDESSPMVDARLPDGSRVNAIIPPLSLVGPVLTIRKFRKIPLPPTALLSNGTITAEALQFLRACVRGKLNIIVAGGSGAGKTTLLNTLSSYIPNGERIVSIEDAAELKLQQDHIVTLEARPANVEGSGEIAIRDLFRNALRMRPDRVVIGECRGGEALDMLQAMNTGHDGSLTTVHANNARDALARVETMVIMSGADLPLRAVREQIAAAIDLVVYIERLQDGTRRVTQVSEVRGMESDLITMQDIYAFKREGLHGGKVVGSLLPSGIRPGFSDDLIGRGIVLPPTWFGYERDDRSDAARQ
jgi:pilus assembly protein CpaF